MARKSIKKIQQFVKQELSIYFNLKLSPWVCVWNSQFNSKPPANSDNIRTTEIRRILSKLNPISPIFRNPLQKSLPVCGSAPPSFCFFSTHLFFFFSSYLSFLPLVTTYCPFSAQVLSPKPFSIQPKTFFSSKPFSL